MCRFIIRDLIWLTVVVALVLAWYRSHTVLNSVHQKQIAEISEHRFAAISQAQRMRVQLLAAKETCDALEKDFSWALHQMRDRMVRYSGSARPQVDWSVLNEPVPPNPSTTGR